jgi:predicted secreted Zn-dependent protease
MSFPIRAVSYVSPAGKPCHAGAVEVNCTGMVFLTQVNRPPFSLSDLLSVFDFLIFFPLASSRDPIAKPD